MQTIFKTWKKATYFKGLFILCDKNLNYAHPIGFPTVFTAYGAGIKSGGWQSYTSINTSDYVINEYFDTVGHNKHDAMYTLWGYCKRLESVTWNDVYSNKSVQELINLANNELLKLKII